MSITVLVFITLMLSSVTDSCTSFSRYNAVKGLSFDNLTDEMTKQKPVISPSPLDYIAETSKKKPIILPSDATLITYDELNKQQPQKRQQQETIIINASEDHRSAERRAKNSSTSLNLPGEPCEEDFEREFCHNNGQCYVEKLLDGDPQARCICKPPYSGDRCMHKEPDSIVTPLRDFSKEHHSTTGRGAPCPVGDDKYDLYCGEFGRCLQIEMKGGYELYCECHDPYYGSRCEQKRLDFYHEYARNRRNIDVMKMRKNRNRRFHSTTLVKI